MTSYGEPQVWLQEFPLNQPVAFYGNHLGLRYRGEVIRADRWLTGCGSPLSGENFFRIVLPQQRRRSAIPTISDPRIAVCLPGTGLAQRRNRLTHEMSTIRETQAVYLTRRDTDSELIRTTLQRRQQSLEEQVMGEDAVRYSGWQIVTASGAAPDPVAIFAGLDPLEWFSDLAELLLSAAYQTLPIDGSLLPRPVTADDVGRLYPAVFGQPGAATEVLAQLVPGLGLSSIQDPAVLDFPACPIGSLIRNRLSELTTPALWSDLHHYLAHEIGVTGPLASLYLSLYLFNEEPDFEVRLESNHDLRLVGGRRLPGGLISKELMPLIIWTPEIDGWATTLGPATQPQWNDALLYLSSLSPDLKPIGDAEDFKDQETLLLRSLITRGQELIIATEFLQALTAEARDAADLELSASLARLVDLSGDDFVSGYPGYHSARRIYPDYRQLESDLAALRQLFGLAQWQDEILQAQEYLRKADVPSNMSELSIQRQALQEALEPGPLSGITRGWEAQASQISRFKSEYALAYRNHHQEIQRSLPSYLQDLESAKRKTAAHALLNTLPELGEPTGLGLSEAVEQMDQGPGSCLVTATGLDLESGPECTSCHLSLTRFMPGEELARLLTNIDGVLGEKNRRLSSLLVEQMLHGHTDEHMAAFLNIVRASDLSALSNTLSEELLDLIRGLLA